MLQDSEGRLCANSAGQSSLSPAAAVCNALLGKMSAVDYGCLRMKRMLRLQPEPRADRIQHEARHPPAHTAQRAGDLSARAPVPAACCQNSPRSFPRPAVPAAAVFTAHRRRSRHHTRHGGRRGGSARSRFCTAHPTRPAARTFRPAHPPGTGAVTRTVHRQTG